MNKTCNSDLITINCGLFERTLRYINSIYLVLFNNLLSTETSRHYVMSQNKYCKREPFVSSFNPCNFLIVIIVYYLIEIMIKKEIITDILEQTSRKFIYFSIIPSFCLLDVVQGFLIRSVQFILI